MLQEAKEESFDYSLIRDFWLLKSTQLVSNPILIKNDQGLFSLAKDHSVLHFIIEKSLEIRGLALEFSMQCPLA